MHQLDGVTIAGGIEAGSTTTRHTRRRESKKSKDADVDPSATSIRHGTANIQDAINGLQQQIDNQMAILSGSLNGLVEDNLSPVEQSVVKDPSVGPAVSEKKKRVANKRLLESTADNAGKAKCVVAGEQMQESDGVSWQTLDSEIHLRRPMRPSQQTEHAKALTFSQARPTLGLDDGQAPAELDRQPGADPAVESRRQFFQPAKSEPESKVVQPVERQRSAYSSRYCSPSVDQMVNVVGKCDDCRCRGTLQHGPFRRDATPGYSTGDCCRPPSPPAAVAARRNNDERHPTNHDLISVRQKMKFEGKVESNACNAKEEGDAGDSSSR